MPNKSWSTVGVAAPAACSDSSSDASDAASSGSPDRAPTTTSASVTPSAAADSQAGSAEVTDIVDRFVAAINAGDADAVSALFATAARFDSVGRICDGRDEIMGNFLIPEVIELGGQYDLLGTTIGGGGRIVVEYDFVTDSGHREHVTYDCAVTDEQFTDCVGDYV